MWVKIFTAICADQFETPCRTTHSFNKAVFFFKTPPSHYKKDGIHRTTLSDLNLTLPVQIPHPTPAVVEFPTPLAQVMGGLPRGGCEVSI